MISPRPTDTPLRVLIAGGGPTGAEALLALRALAADRVSLTLLNQDGDLRLPPLSVAEPFALGHVPTIPLAKLAESTGAEFLTGSLARVDAGEQTIDLSDGRKLSYDALLLALGARPVVRVEHALTWWPRGEHEAFSGLLRDLEEGYAKRVAFVLPEGPVWPLPVYELALMTAREVATMGIEDAELTVITPEPNPLTGFGAEAARVLSEELAAAGVRLEAGCVARVERENRLKVVLQPSTRRLAVDRVVALPGVMGPAVPGTVHNGDGFILVDRRCRMCRSTSVWAAGDAVAGPVKHGSLSTHQADVAAADIARRAGVACEAPRTTPPALRGVLLTGEARRGRRIGEPNEHGRDVLGSAPEGKLLFGRHLTPFLEHHFGVRPHERRSDVSAGEPRDLAGSLS